MRAMSGMMTLLVLSALLGGSAGARAEGPGGDDVLDEAGRSEVVRAAAAALRQGYIYDEVGERLAADLERRAAAGEYDGLDDPQAFGRRLTLDLFAIADDRHLRVDPAPPEDEASPEAEHHPIESRLSIPEAFRSVEILDGNVGYLDLRHFGGGEDALPRASAAMAFLHGVDALILDLGNNPGGGPYMVRLISTYLFDGPTHLASTFMRGWEEPRERWTLDEVPGERLADIPVYVLTSRRTFSAAESFTFGLKVNDRVTLVGERTGGGGHFGERIELPRGMMMFLPQGRTYDPRTGRGWEAEGIAPDVAVPYEEALAAAHRRALEEVGRGR